MSTGARYRPGTTAAGSATLRNQFDPQVIAFMRSQFDAADIDGSGEIDSTEAAQLLEKLGGGGATQAERLRSAENLIRAMDSDRNGTLSFEEFCFRFGRRFQMELAQQRRAATGNAAPSIQEVSGGRNTIAPKVDTRRLVLATVLVAFVVGGVLWYYRQQLGASPAFSRTRGYRPR